MWILESFRWNLVHLRSIPCCIWPWKHQASLLTCWSGICATALFFCVRKGYPATSISFQSQSFQRQRSAKYAKQHETHIFSGGDSVFLESSFSGSMPGFSWQAHNSQHLQQLRISTIIFFKAVPVRMIRLMISCLGSTLTISEREIVCWNNGHAMIQWLLN